MHLLLLILQLSNFEPLFAARSLAESWHKPQSSLTKGSETPSGPSGCTSNPNIAGGSCPILDSDVKHFVQSSPYSLIKQLRNSCILIIFFLKKFCFHPVDSYSCTREVKSNQYRFLLHATI